MNEPRAEAKKLRSKYKKTYFGYKDLKKAAKDLGYSLVEFNAVVNEGPVAVIIENLNVQAYTRSSKGFTYADGNNRIVFINEDLSNDEKALVLSHEIGHIVCRHFSREHIIGNDVVEENEANEFSHYLMHPGLWVRISSSIGRHIPILVVIALLLVAAIITVLVINSRPASVKSDSAHEMTDYYVTSSGLKYHTKDCGMIAGNTTLVRLTAEQLESGNYKPCEKCLSYLSYDRTATDSAPFPEEFGEFYLTDTGKKYHKKNCVRIKNNETVTQMTEEQFLSGIYTPCEVCMPSEEES